MTDPVEIAVKALAKTPHMTQKQVAVAARRKKLLNKMRDAEIEALLALCRAFTGDKGSGAWDALTDEVCDKMSSDETYEKFESLCLEVLELRRRLRSMGMDGWARPDDVPAVAEEKPP